MTRTQGLLLDTLNPVRDICLSRVLEEMSSALTQGYDCRTDVIARDETGEIARDGVLNLPYRYDLEKERGAERVRLDVGERLHVRFDPAFLRLGNEAPVSIVPFHWNAMPLILDLGETSPDWLPLRRWYLEAFQARFDEEAPEFQGAVHRVAGPEPLGDGRWRFEIDLGSAPIDCLTDLLEALSQLGVRKVVLGGHAEDTAKRD